MRTPAVALVSAILVSVFGLSQPGVIGDVPSIQVAPYNLVDPIIKAILEAMRPKLADLKFDDVHQEIDNPNLKGTLNIDNIAIQNADKFVIQSLKSTILPLKLSNLTLTWSDISAGAGYDIDSTVVVPELKHPIRLFAKGEASALFENLYFTVGANFEMKNKAIQIKPRGLFGFDLRMGSTKVTLSSLMGNTELGDAIGTFLSDAIPTLVNSLKKPLFDVFQDDIIAVLNQFLKKNPTGLFSDEFQQQQDFSSDSLDLSDEIDPFFSGPLGSGAELDDDKDFNF